jgi:catechol 2,3-dioxygenase-like lactoylglutathione lyase family enzyme
VLDCPDAHALGDFYRKLLGWEVKRTDHDWVLLEPPNGGTHLSFQSEADYVAPVWPEKPGEQQKMIHLDIQVDDLETAGAHALAAGATLAPWQPRDDIRIYLDPAGHPFCLFVDDCYAAYEDLRARGAVFLTEPQERGSETRCFFRDPDGHLFEISAIR